MKVKCIHNSGDFLFERNVNPKLGLHSKTEFFVTPGKEYVVYGFTLHNGQVWYYLADDTFSFFPIWHPAELFELVDGRMSRHWFIGYYKLSDYPIVPIISFKEWADNHVAFYNRLLNEGKNEVEIFRNWKKIMDEEYE